VALTSYGDGSEVYEPAEDSFLLVDALLEQRPFLQQRLGNDAAASAEGPCCLEVGSGSGFVIASLWLLLRREGRFFATDVNPAAVRATARTLRNHGAAVQVEAEEDEECRDGRTAAAAAAGQEPNATAVRVLRVADLAGPLTQQLAGRVDVLLFNPPYVPTPPEEVGGAGIEAAWAGGAMGREVIDRFLPLVPELLSPRGVCYLVTVRENAPGDILRLMARHHRLDAAAVRRARAGTNEELHVLRFHRSGVERGSGDAAQTE